MPRGAPKAHLVVDIPREGWQRWTSSNLVAGQWIPDREGGEIGRLFCWFDNKKSPACVYIYSEVPERAWLALCNASSKGKHHWNSIRDRYPMIGPLATP